jgi:hypothetical protein
MAGFRMCVSFLRCASGAMAFMPLLDGTRRLGRCTQDIVLGHVGERHHTPAVLGRELLGGSLVGERHRLVRAHAALPPAADHEERLARIDPVRGTGLVPVRGLGHVRHVDRADVLRLLRQHGEGDRVPRRREPHRLLAARQKDLPLRTRMLQHVHAAVMADGCCRQFLGRRRGLGGLLAVASSQRERTGKRCEEDGLSHNSLLEKANAASPSGTRAQAARAARRPGGFQVAFCATPAMPENALTPAEPVRLNRR